MKHPALVNYERYYAKEITLEELVELNNKLVSEVKLEKPVIPDVVKRARDIFGTGNACPKDKDDPESERWNF